MGSVAQTVVDVSEPLENWYRATVGSVSEREVLRRLEKHLGEPFDSRKIATHLRQSNPNARTVVAIAHLFGASTVEALVAAGLLTHQELWVAAAAEALRSVSDKELADEVSRRLVERTYGPSGELSRPIADIDVPDVPGEGRERSPRRSWPPTEPRFRP